MRLQGRVRISSAILVAISSVGLAALATTPVGAQSEISSLVLEPPRGFHIGAMVTYGKPYLLGQTKRTWRGVGSFEAAVGWEATLDYYGRRLGFGLALGQAHPSVGAHSGRTTDVAALLHLPVGNRMLRSWRPALSVGYARVLYEANMVALSEFTGRSEHAAYGGDPYILGDGARVVVTLSRDLSSHLALGLSARADVLAFGSSVHAYPGEMPGVGTFSAPSSAGWGITPRASLGVRWRF